MRLPADKKKKWLLFWLIITPGIITLAIGGCLYLMDRLFENGAVETNGKVIRLISQPRSRGSGLGVTPQVEYNVNNQNYTIEGTLYYREANAPFKVGDTIVVKYNPQNPAEAYLPLLGLNTNSSLVLTIGIIGVVTPLFLFGMWSMAIFINEKASPKRPPPASNK